MEHTKELLRLTKYIYLLGCAFLCLSVSVCLSIYLSTRRPGRSSATQAASHAHLGVAVVRSTNYLHVCSRDDPDGLSLV